MEKIIKVKGNCFESIVVDRVVDDNEIKELAKKYNKTVIRVDIWQSKIYNWTLTSIYCC